MHTGRHFALPYSTLSSHTDPTLRCSTRTTESLGPLPGPWMCLLPAQAPPKHSSCASLVEIILGFGGTHVYMWDDDPHELARQVQVLLIGITCPRAAERSRSGFA